MQQLWCQGKWKGESGWVWINTPDLKQCAYKDWPMEARSFGINTQAGSCHECRLEKGREVAEKRRMIWGQAAAKLKTSILSSGPVEGHKSLLTYYLGFLKKLTWSLPNPVSKLDGTTVDHWVSCFFSATKELLSNKPFLSLCPFFQFWKENKVIFFFPWRLASYNHFQNNKWFHSGSKTQRKPLLSSVDVLFCGTKISEDSGRQIS